jgi:shikimate dehydrogenase
MKQAGTIAFKVLYSRAYSSRMYQVALDERGIDARYSFWETPPERLSERVAALRDPDVMGAVVASPYKARVASLVDECHPLATRIGAITAIVNCGGRLVGYNTESPGLMRVLTEFARPAFDCHGKRAVIFGTGVTARAAVLILQENGIEEMIVIGRIEEQRRELQENFSTSIPGEHGTVHIQCALLGGEQAIRSLTRADIVVKAISLRQEDTAWLLAEKALPTGALVVDMLQNPPKTAFSLAANAHGCRFLGALYQALYQGALTFELWTDLPAPLKSMHATLGLVHGADRLRY